MRYSVPSFYFASQEFLSVQLTQVLAQLILIPTGSSVVRQPNGALAPFADHKRLERKRKEAEELEQKRKEEEEFEQKRKADAEEERLARQKAKEQSKQEKLKKKQQQKELKEQQKKQKTKQQESSTARERSRTVDNGQLSREHSGSIADKLTAAKRAAARLSRTQREPGRRSCIRTFVITVLLFFVCTCGWVLMLMFKQTFLCT
eukprot:m.277837 g.277837  ORF g.277837 m.277837 type:complete len:204 (+) comp15732_c4_seq7:1052-1663(+)